MSGKTDYISQMVTETFGGAQDNVLEFKLPEKEECSQIEMDFSPTRAIYDKERRCLVLELEGERVELPANFGPLSQVDFESDQAHLYVSLHKDPEKLIEVLSAHLNRPLESMEIYAAEGGLKLDARFANAFQQAA